MPASGRDLRRKLKSIRSTQKITSAMQLVAASKMQRAIRRALESRPFSGLAAEIVNSLSPDTSQSDASVLTTQPLFTKRPLKTVLVLLVTTNRGLAGPLNTQLFRRFTTWHGEQLHNGRTVRVVVVGAKGRQFVTRFARAELIGDFATLDRVPDYREASPIAQLLINEFEAGRTDAVYLAYNHFVSSLRQEPEIVPYLPFRRANSDQEAKIDDHQPSASDLLFEPSQEEVLATLLPRYLRVHLYQVLLETHACEQAARMLAMKNATDNAGDLLDDLTLTYNSLRQTAITGELLDIAAGAAALEG